MTRLFLVAALLFTLTPTHSKADEFDVLVTKVNQFYKDRSDFSARFTQKVVRAHLPNRPVKKEGKVFFQKPGRMRWDYTKPDAVYYISDGSILWNYVPEAKIAYKMNVKDSDLFFALRFLYGEGDLAKDFLLEDGGSQGPNRVIVLKPRDGQQNFKELKLIVAPADGQITETVLTDPAGNVSHISFLKVSFKPLPLKGFSFQPPDDVQVEDLTQKAKQ